MSPQIFKACLKVLRKCHLYYLSQLTTPTGSHLISWTAYRAAYIAQLANKRGRFLPHKWYLDIQAHTTIPDSHDRLHSRFVCSSSVTLTATLIPGVTTTQKNRHWLVTLDGHDAPLFGKQLSVQPKKDTCVIVHWTSDCLSSSDDVIHLRPCLGCDAHIPFPSANKYAAVAPRCTFTISLLKSLILLTNCELSYSRRLDISPDFFSSSLVVDDDLVRNSPPCGSSSLPSPIILPPGSHYRFYTNEVAAIFAALSVFPDDSTISIYTDSQAAIDGLRLCAFSSYTNSHSYYKTTNFELWASIECSIRAKRLTVFPVKVKGHASNYWNEFADSLANSAHHSDDAIFFSMADFTSSHNVRLVYDDVVCESNPRRLFKLYYQATFMKDLLSLKRFQFTFCLRDRDDYVVDWELTWFSLNFSPVHDASFQAHHASRHYTFKFKLFLDDLPLLEKLKLTCPDLYIDLLTCRSCRNRKEDLLHLILCPKRKWEDVMNITFKLKTTLQPSNLPATLYVPFSSLPPPTQLMTSRDSRTDWIKNSMIQELPWYNHFIEFNGSSNGAT
ncbi:ribonuclease H-like domain-containing protein [Rhizophagus clarus]|uniref:Ribonuclease H-like domain-containing protein n=1 Tax=Rhizophagus clarus TaxID=94130 RepID=A0A8H3QU91_9GLOM|nr:ribonuclease H-like domain-containing protein [Rhizophagus clarus]